MKMSVDDLWVHPEFKSLWVRSKVYVNGVEQHCVISFDTENGEVIKEVVDIDGNLVVDEQKREIVNETVKGEVKIEVTSRWRHALKKLIAR